MSNLLTRRNSNLSGLSNYSDAPGSIIKFQWSVSAADQPSMENSTTNYVPPIDIDRSQAKHSIDLSSSTSKFISNFE